MSTTFLERLAARSARTGTVLCLGIDPDPAALPAGLAPTLDGVERFSRLLVEAALPSVAAVKPNLAFFEAFGSAGMAALERIRAAVPSDVPFVADAKRGDIGSTAARQAAALFDGLGADAVTVNPYLLCRTSNPGGGELQGQIVAADETIGAPEEPLWARVARRATAWGPGGTVGLVVGATNPAELPAIRVLAPGLGFLVPGLGAQGGDIEPVLAAGPATAAPAGGKPGGGLLVSVSRGIARAALDAPAGASRDPGERVAAAAADWSARLPVLP